MKRKISLLLAFAMVVTLLPVTSAEAALTNPRGGTRPHRGLVATTNATGTLWQNQGPVSNLRHWASTGNQTVGSRSDGVFVGREDVVVEVNSLTPNVNGTNSGALRHLMVASDYFAAAPTAQANYASMLVQINNVGTFLLRHANLGTGAFWDINNEAVNLNQFRAPWTNTTSGALRPPAVPPSDSPLVDVVLDAGNTINESGLRTVINAARAKAGISDIIVDAADFDYELSEIGVTGFNWANPVTVGAMGIHLAKNAAGTESIIYGRTISQNPYFVVDADGNLWNITGTDSVFGWASIPSTANWESIFMNGGTARTVLAMDYVEYDPSTTANPGQPREWFIAALVHEPGLGTDAYGHGRVALLHLIRSDEMPTSTITGNVSPATGSGVPFVALPIEYITNGDSNDNPVHLLLTHRSGFQQASATGRIDLSVAGESRFTFDRSGGPRSFHRYGSVVVGGTGRDNGIRIREATQNAFDQTDWWVEMEIVTPGFFWTEQSADSIRNPGNKSLNSQPNITTRYQEAQGSNHLQDDVQTFNVTRGPQGTNTSDSNRWLEFGMRLPQVNLQHTRLVEDWVNFRNLHIGASDRARPGNVEVEVRLYRPVFETGNVTSSYWSVRTTGSNPPLVNNAITSSELNTAWGLINQLNPSDIVTRYVLRNTNTNEISLTTSVPTLVNPPLAPLEWTGAEFNYTQTGNIGQAWGRGEEVASGTVTAAVFGEVGLIWEVHENDDPVDFVLRSGMQEWTYSAIADQANGRPIGAINDLADITDRYHRTARGVLRETVAGSIPGSGAAPITFDFNEGVEVLGVRIWTNDGHFSRDGENERDGGGSPVRRPGEVTFGYNREADNFLAASIERNSVTIRPEIGQNIERRHLNAEVTLEFYVSVMPGYEHVFGFDEIEVTASANVDGMDWDETITLAYAWDPITVDVEPTVIDGDTIAEFGLIRGASISDVTINETESGAFYAGTRIWIGVEGGNSRSWGQSDHIALSAASAKVVGDDQLQISPVRNDSHGAYVEILRTSRNDGAQIVFEGVTLSGRVLAEENYNIFVAESGVAANWDGFNWLNNTGAWSTGVGFARGDVRGFFHNEPYDTAAFSFTGTDAAIPAPPTVTDPTPVTPITPTVPVVTSRSVNLRQGASYTLTDGSGETIAPAMTLIPTTPGNVSSFVSVRAVADIAGLPWGPGQSNWDEAANTATFTDGVNTVTFTVGSGTAMVNGVPVPLVASGQNVTAQIVGGRMLLPIGFFNEPQMSFFNTFVEWHDHPTPGERSITVHVSGR